MTTRSPSEDVSLPQPGTEFGNRKASDFSMRNLSSKGAANVKSSAVAVDISDESQKPRHGLRFWMCIVAIMVSSFLMVLDLVSSGRRLFWPRTYDPIGWDWNRLTSNCTRPTRTGIRMGRLCIRTLGDCILAYDRRTRSSNSLQYHSRSLWTYENFQVFGRRIIMLIMVFLFAVGSAMCGAAPSMNFLIASRSTFPPNFGVPVRIR